MCSRIDMQTHVSSHHRSSSFDLLTSGSMHSEGLPWTIWRGVYPSWLVEQSTTFLNVGVDRLVM